MNFMCLLNEPGFHSHLRRTKAAHPLGVMKCARGKTRNSKQPAFRFIVISPVLTRLLVLSHVTHGIVLRCILFGNQALPFQ